MMKKERSCFASPGVGSFRRLLGATPLFQGSYRNCMPDRDQRNICMVDDHRICPCAGDRHRRPAKHRVLVAFPTLRSSCLAALPRVPPLSAAFIVSSFWSYRGPGGIVNRKSALLEGLLWTRMIGNVCSYSCIGMQVAQIDVGKITETGQMTTHAKCRETRSWVWGVIFSKANIGRRPFPRPAPAAGNPFPGCR